VKTRLDNANIRRNVLHFYVLVEIFVILIIIFTLKLRFKKFQKLFVGRVFEDTDLERQLLNIQILKYQLSKKSNV
jgi:hypothetical protein